eukprot:CAMPEP_0113588364 /NCGR_PEP_ID=MMETSP0015_2-20120614/35468_1 /TAXON_ID=2838 /ORGANISM="Odontella" /LENGTH=40 /DNA_ID=CAMNT_0000494217 /DNA_START=843 /DNA_END=962 /DNA_ORIENTATION=- /assembly_acc=CAM_ASM_000160
MAGNSLLENDVWDDFSVIAALGGRDRYVWLTSEDAEVAGQ